MYAPESLVLKEFFRQWTVRCFHLFTRRIPSFVTMSEKQQRLVYAIIEFINQSIKEGTVKADDQDSLEVASSLIFYFHLINLCLTCF